MLNIVVTNIGNFLSWKTTQIEMMAISPKLNGIHRTST